MKRPTFFNVVFFGSAPPLLPSSFIVRLALYLLQRKTQDQGVTKRCRISWLTNSALVYEPKCGGGDVAGSQPMSTALPRSPNKLWRSNSIFYKVYCSNKSPLSTKQCCQVPVVMQGHLLFVYLNINQLLKLSKFDVLISKPAYTILFILYTYIYSYMPML